MKPNYNFSGKNSVRGKYTGRTQTPRGGAPRPTIKKKRRLPRLLTKGYRYGVELYRIEKNRWVTRTKSLVQVEFPKKKPLSGNLKKKLLKLMKELK